MKTIYKIHPGIGVARVGPSRAGYFFAGEAEGEPGFEINDQGEETAFSGFKDASMFMRRQGVRFRVFEYLSDEVTGQEQFSREITADDAQITWTVRLAATKAAMFQQKGITYEGEVTLIQGDVPRNEGEPPASLRTEILLQISGASFMPPEGTATLGEIRGRPIYLGEARTDAKGRLVVLPGWGDAFNWSDASGTDPELVDYYDNPGWYDDIADGSVDATVAIGGAEPVAAQGAWVITAPPDFAPDTMAVTTLHDIALEGAGASLPNPLTFPQDIQPLLERAAGLAQTNDVQDKWWNLKSLMRTLDGISDNSDAARQKRIAIAESFEDGCAVMAKYSLTKRQQQIVARYRSGEFQTLADAGRRPPTPAEELDRAALDRCVGGGFLPGIEAGHTLRLPGIFSSLGRLTRGEFTDWDGTRRTLAPGLLSGRMACPWHADFMQCKGAWWPSQRPDITGRTSTANKGPAWDRPLIVVNEGTTASMMNMVRHFAQLGVVVAKGDGSFAEVGRDPHLDQTTP